MTECVADDDALHIMEDDGDESWEDDTDSNSAASQKSDAEKEELVRFENEAFNQQLEQKSEKYSFTWRNMKKFFKVGSKLTCFMRVIFLVQVASRTIFRDN